AMASSFAGAVFGTSTEGADQIGGTGSERLVETTKKADLVRHKIEDIMPDSKFPGKPLIQLGEPIVISQAPTELRNWGPWQFPSIQRHPDGRLQIRFHIAKDSAKDYGHARGSAFSSDNGKLWSPMTQIPDAEKIVTLPNGDWIQSVQMASVSVATVVDELPQPVDRIKHSYGDFFVDFYAANEMPAQFQAWKFRRKKGGQGDWVEKFATVNLPGAIRYVSEDVLVFPWFWRIRVAPDGSVWAITYQRVLRDGRVTRQMPAQILRSSDSGKSWDLWSEIPYQPILAADPFGGKRQGFTEPDITWLPDGSVFCLLRTTDGNGLGPSYRTRSTDGGRTWCRPEIFDKIGVWPTLLTLKNGVTLASYGRSGLFIRATSMADASVWEEPIPVVAPLAYQTDTCSYSDMMALDDSTALLVYSDFNWPDQQDRPCKTILVRTVTISQ
ncbi:exo-alpha-sialidase, partial [bacterium]|nr:exo-alpha-sialidase [bacterium]